MFANLISALQGEPSNDEQAQQVGVQNEGEEEQQQQQSSSMDMWRNITTGLTNTVKKSAKDLITSVQETDWKQELTAFGQGLSDDTKKISNKTVQAVEHLPDSAVEALPVLRQQGEQVKQKLGVVGNQLSSFGQQLYAGTKEIIETVKDQVEKDIGEAAQSVRKPNRTVSSNNNTSIGATTGAKYNRLQAEIASMQRDSSTYLEEPEDVDNFQQWRTNFSISSKRSEIDKIIKENAFMGELQQRIVPLIVDHDTFWTRYFYRLQQLQDKHAQRVALTSKEVKVEEEEVSWDDQPTPRIQNTHDLGTPQISEISEDPKEDEVSQEQVQKIEGFQNPVETQFKTKEDAASVSSSVVCVDHDNGNGSEASSQSSWQVVCDKKTPSPPISQDHSFSQAVPAIVEEDSEDSKQSQPPTILSPKKDETQTSQIQQQKKQQEKSKLSDKTIEEELEDFDVDDVAGEDDGEEVDEDWGTWE
eukprot:TRINITY_DN1234_c0_g2_i1.p1 TRINITY_DN1234_c0_g2~~TRINITY_DN1234_c0_g2_i1.p1  ORF type:complete len:473 (-),score=102.27 TRINITY_DN1234_c0_g2_i1:543-1961(-)